MGFHINRSIDLTFMDAVLLYRRQNVENFVQAVSSRTSFPAIGSTRYRALR